MGHDGGVTTTNGSGDTSGVPAGARQVVPLTRPSSDRVLAGVCSGLARHLSVPVRVVRIAFVVASGLGGAGLGAYLLFWLMTPVARESTPPGGRPAGDRSASRLVLGGLALLVVAGVLFSDNGQGRLSLTLTNLLPLVAIIGGAVLAWSHLDDRERARWLGAAETDGRAGLVRVGIGAALAVTGVVVLVWRRQGFVLMWDVAIATLAVLAGLGLVLAPWGLRFWNRYQDEQASRIRETERADIAAHLHDSVLQTLALIQRTEDPQRVTLLARAQERELRTWLYGGVRSSRETLAAAIHEVVDEVEELHGVPVDVVATGDRPYDEPGEALVRATREALLNAVRHGAPPVSVYVEIGPRLVEVFVRDRGPGFDLDTVPEDRLGVRESILGRMARHGGQARIRRLEEGTEVSLTLPVEPPQTDPPPPSGETAGRGDPESTSSAKPEPEGVVHSEGVVHAEKENTR